jgi:hypothetical protein
MRRRVRNQTQLLFFICVSCRNILIIWIGSKETPSLLSAKCQTSCLGRIDCPAHANLSQSDHRDIHDQSNHPHYCNKQQ